MCKWNYFLHSIDISKVRPDKLVMCNVTKPDKDVALLRIFQPKHISTEYTLGIRILDDILLIKFCNN